MRAARFGLQKRKGSLIFIPGHGGGKPICGGKA
jgi:hypothetical protein